MFKADLVLTIKNSHNIYFVSLGNKGCNALNMLGLFMVTAVVLVTIKYVKIFLSNFPLFKRSMIFKESSGQKESLKKLIFIIFKN